MTPFSGWKKCNCHTTRNIFSRSSHPPLSLLLPVYYHPNLFKEITSTTFTLAWFWQSLLCEKRTYSICLSESPLLCSCRPYSNFVILRENWDLYVGENLNCDKLLHYDIKQRGGRPTFRDAKLSPRGIRGDSTVLEGGSNPVRKSSVYSRPLISILMQSILNCEASNILCFIYTDYTVKQNSCPCTIHEGISGAVVVQGIS